MTPWAQSQILGSEVALFKEIRRAVDMFPDIDLGVSEDGERLVLSCHILTRAVARVFGLVVQDGYFHPNCSHSWLLLPSGAIIDVYPIGIIGGPLLVMNDPKWSPGKWLYKPASTRVVSRHSACSFSKPCFRKAVSNVARALRFVRRPSLDLVGVYEKMEDTRMDNLIKVTRMVREKRKRRLV